jgi:hypothetical protein
VQSRIITEAADGLARRGGMRSNRGNDGGSGNAMRSSTGLGLVAVIALVVNACTTLPATTTQRQPTASARDSLAASELAFAKYSVDHGMRAAFIEYFADDGGRVSAPAPR